MRHEVVAASPHWVTSTCLSVSTPKVRKNASERIKEIERKGKKEWKSVCVCVRERERDRDREGETERGWMGRGGGFRDRNI